MNMLSSMLVSFSPQLLGDLMLGNKKILGLVDKNQQARMERIFGEVLKLFGEEEVKLFEAMDLTTNLQLHLNRQIISMQPKPQLPETSKGLITHAANQPEKN